MHWWSIQKQGGGTLADAAFDSVHAQEVVLTMSRRLTYVSALKGNPCPSAAAPEASGDASAEVAFSTGPSAAGVAPASPLLKSASELSTLDDLVENWTPAV